MKQYLSKTKSGHILILAIFVYIAIFSILSIWKLNHFYYDNLDLAIFNQVFFNTLNGYPFAATIHPPTYLQDHFTPFVYLLIPFYALKPGPEILLFLQSIVIGLTAWPIYLISKHVLGPEKKLLVLFPPLIWLANPLTHNMNFFEFHLLPFGVFIIFWMLYAYLKEKKYLFALLFILVLLVREDFALILLFMSLIALIHKRSLYWKLFPFIVSLIYMYTAFSIIALFSPHDTYKFIGYYDWLGGETIGSILFSFLSHPIEVIKHLLTFNNLQFVLGLTFPFLFIVFSFNAYNLLIIAPLAQFMLSIHGGNPIILMTHYTGYFLIGFIMVFIYQISRIENNQWPVYIPKVFRSKTPFYLILLLAAVYGSFTYGAIGPALAKWNVYNYQTEKQQLVKLLPDDVPVATTFSLLSQLSSRANLYSFHYAYLGKNQYSLLDYDLPKDTEYLLLDWNEMFTMQVHITQDNKYKSQVPNLSSRITEIFKNFEAVEQNGPIMIMRRSDEAIQQLAKLTIDPTVKLINQPTLINLVRSNGELRLSIALPIRTGSERYYLEISDKKGKYILPLGYLMYPPLNWKENNVMTMRIPDSPDLTPISIQLFEWRKGKTLLSKLKNISVETDAKPIGDMIKELGILNNQ